MTQDAQAVEPGAKVPPEESTGLNPMLIVQSLKGAPASVLLALSIAGRFMTHQELQLWTRCGKDQISFALQSLLHLGWVVGKSTRGPWALAASLPFPAPDLFVDPNPLKGLGGGSGTESLNPHILEETPPPSAPRKELLDGLRAVGIREPTASELAQLPHVNLDYVQAHLQGARANGLGIGAAIQAIRLNAPPPAPPRPKNRAAEVEEKMRRFKEGG